MKCDACESGEATVFLTQIVNGKMQKVNLCPACAKAKGVDDPTGFQLTDLLLGLGSAQTLEPSSALLKCSVCGFTQTDLKKTGRLGCSHCYEVFAAPLAAMIKNMHKGTAHTGKVPARFRQAQERQATLSTLQDELSQAISQENYEEAARLRDRIRCLLESEGTELASNAGSAP